MRVLRGAVCERCRARPRHLTYSFRTKAAPTDPCIASVSVPGNLIQTVCQASAQTGTLPSGLYAPVAPFSTFVLKLANRPQLLGYSESFFDGVTAAWLGLVVSADS